MSEKYRIKHIKEVDLKEKMINFADESRRVCRWRKRQRKVRATKGAALPNGKSSVRANHRRRE